MTDVEPWSPSRARLYDRCPRAWWLTYRSGLPRGADRPLHWRRGSVMHAGLEGLFLPFLTGRLRRVPLHRALAVARRAIDDAWREYAMPADPIMRAEVDDWVRAVAYSLAAPAPGALLGLEIELTDHLPGGRPVRGIVDQALAPAPGWLHLRDWKSYSNPPSEDGLRTDLQQGVYAWLGARAWPIVRGAALHRVTVEIFCPPSLRSRSVEMHPELREHHAGVIADIAERAEHDRDFVPRPSPWCSTCDARALCPLYDNRITFGPHVDAAALEGVRAALVHVEDF